MAIGVIPLTILVAAIAVLYHRFQSVAPEHLFQFQILSILSVCGYFLTIRVIPTVMSKFVEHKLFGRDINKNGTTPMYDILYLTTIDGFQL